MKGVILAGGKGTRLHPATLVMNKHMVPILNKPMILYPIETLKSLGITDILIVSGGNHIGDFADFLGSGEKYDVNLTYRVQEAAGGIAQALSLAEDYVGDDDVAVILGDNIFGHIDVWEPYEDWAGIFVKQVKDASRFGVYMAESEEIVEKPLGVEEGFAVTGFYIYPPDVFDVIRTLKPSDRGELEITDVNNHYLREGRCLIRYVDSFWSDAGTPQSLGEVTKWALDKYIGEV